MNWLALALVIVVAMMLYMGVSGMKQGETCLVSVKKPAQNGSIVPEMKAECGVTQ